MQRLRNLALIEYDRSFPPRHPGANHFVGGIVNPTSPLAGKRSRTVPGENFLGVFALRVAGGAVLTTPSTSPARLVETLVPRSFFGAAGTGGLTPPSNLKQSDLPPPKLLRREKEPGGPSPSGSFEVMPWLANSFSSFPLQ